MGIEESEGVIGGVGGGWRIGCCFNWGYRLLRFGTVFVYYEVDTFSVSSYQFATEMCD